MSGARTVLVYSKASFDDSHAVHFALDKLHKEESIRIIAHLGRGAGAYASAWARVARPYVSEFVSRAEYAKTAIDAVMESNVDVLVLFGKPSGYKYLCSLAKRRRIQLVLIDNDNTEV